MAEFTPAWFWLLPQEGRDGVATWLKDHQVNPEQVMAFNVEPDGEGFMVEVTLYEVDELGRGSISLDGKSFRTYTASFKPRYLPIEVTNGATMG